MPDWLLRAETPIPKRLVGEGGAANQMPQRLQSVDSIIATQALIFNGRPFEFRPLVISEAQQSFMPAAQLVGLSTIVQADDEMGAIGAIETDLEAILDDLAFQLQQPLPIASLHLMEASGALELGQSRRMALFPFPQGYSMPKFRSSHVMGNQFVAGEPLLRAPLHAQSRRASAAMSWYLQALASPFNTTRFSLFWIALELIVSDKLEAVVRPYRHSCGHPIDLCPGCGGTTNRRASGDEIKDYLIQNLHLEPEEARDMWRMRQMFHGRLAFTNDGVKDIPRLMILAQAAAALAIKREIGLADAALPAVAHDAPAWNNPFLMGAQEVSQDDVEVVSRLRSIASASDASRP